LLSQEALVKLEYLSDKNSLPLVIQPKIADVSLIDWVKSNVDYIENGLLESGGILFRGFDVTSPADFNDFLKAIPVELMSYMEGATPRVELKDKVYTSTEFPPDQHIALHNELCYVTTWPMKIWFYCKKAAREGGQTPIGDVRKVYTRIDPRIRARFEEHGWMLVRNFGDGFGLKWQTSYRTTSKVELEEYFRRADIEFEWKEGDRLRTRQVRPVAAVHPKTGEKVWFNHTAFWHVSSLPLKLREMFLAEFGEEELPFNTYYGDGAPIEDEVVNVLRQAYLEETVAFKWQEGDILMLDNMLTAHGRFPFEGEREVLVAMGQPFSLKAA